MGSTPQGPYGKPPSGQPAPYQEGDFTPAAKNRVVNFADCEIDPPSEYYMDVDDQWILGAIQPISVNNIQAVLRILRPHGGIETVLIPLTVPTVGAVSTLTRPEREGYLLSASITFQGAPAGLGPWFAWLAVQRAGSTLGNQARIVSSGNLQPNRCLSWPERAPRGPLDEPGTVFSQGIGAAGAGAEVTISAPAFTRVLATMVSWQLVTSAAVATRTSNLRITDGANNLLIVAASLTQAASLTIRYCGYSSGFLGGVNATLAYYPLPEPLYVNGPWTIGTTTNNLQAGDQYQNIGWGGLVWADLV
jgi:hypothetical protein